MPKSLPTLLVLLAGCGPVGGPKPTDPAPEKKLAAITPAPKAGQKPDPVRKPDQKPESVSPAPRPDTQPVAPQPKEPAKKETFDAAMAALPGAAAALKAEWEAERDRKFKLLTAEELDRVKTAIRWCETQDNGLPGDQMRGYGCGKWVQATAVKWAAADPTFQAAARLVWDRSPKSRSANAVLRMAAQWGELDAVYRDAIHRALLRVEGGRELTREERDIVLAFAGEDYLANRP